MSLKKIVSICVGAIISISLIIVMSFVVMSEKLETLEERETGLIEVKDNINKRYLELISWMDKMNDHVIEEWPFEGELDHSKSEMGIWIGSHKPMNARERQIIAALGQKNEDLFQSARELVRIQEPDKKKEYYVDSFRPASDSIKPLIGGLANIFQEDLEDVHDKRHNFLRTLGLFIIASSLATIALIIVTAFALFRFILRPISNLSSKIIEVGRGDLEVSIDYKAKNEIGDIAQNFNRMVQIFNKIIKGVLESSAGVVTTVEELKERAGKTSDGAKQQHMQATHAATATEEMSQTIVEIAQNASVASDTSSGAINIAEEGKGIADGAVETVNRVHNSTVGLAEKIGRLNNSVLEIGEIVTVINGIADQTNLLALNAAIEAARAGEQGRGFAVVADEVRKLAENTIKATAEISDKIGVVQEESKQTTRSMGEASEEVTKATDYIKNLGDSLQSIVDSVQKVRDEVSHIAAAVDQQSSAANEVSGNIEQTAIISNEVEKMSSEVLQDVNNLINIAEELKNSTAGFNTGSSGAGHVSMGNTAVHDVREKDSSL